MQAGTKVGRQAGIGCSQPKDRRLLSPSRAKSLDRLFRSQFRQKSREVSQSSAVGSRLSSVRILPCFLCGKWELGFERVLSLSPCECTLWKSIDLLSDVPVDVDRPVLWFCARKQRGFIKTCLL